MSAVLVVAEVRRGIFEERNLDAFGLCAALGKEAVLVVPDKEYGLDERMVDRIVKVKTEEEAFLNPVNLVRILEQVTGLAGKPEAIVFTHSSSGMESAPYVAGALGLPLISDVSAIDKDEGVFFKSYYSDKIFGAFRCAGSGGCVLTVRSGSFKDLAAPKEAAAKVDFVEGLAFGEERTFIEYVEEEKGEIDITKADFLLSVGRGIGNKDEIPNYEELAGLLRATLSGSRPVIDKLWLPKPRQVGTSGKTVKPKVYLAMGISGAFQHIAGMKDSDCIIAVNKDAGAPIFQYAHFGIIADMHKVRDKLKDMAKG